MTPFFDFLTDQYYFSVLLSCCTPINIEVSQFLITETYPWSCPTRGSFSNSALKNSLVALIRWLLEVVSLGVRFPPLLQYLDPVNFEQSVPLITYAFCIAMTWNQWYSKWRLMPIPFILIRDSYKSTRRRRADWTGTLTVSIIQLWSNCFSMLSILEVFVI